MSLAAQYARDGFVVLEDLLDAATLEALRAEATAVVRGRRGPIVGLEDRPEDDDAAALRRCDCIHYVHKASPALGEVMRHPRLVATLTELVGDNLKSPHSMLHIKPPGQRGQSWHQDEFFLPSRDRSLTAVWIALDDVDAENGCLRVLPGTHARGLIYPHGLVDDPRFDPTLGVPSDRLPVPESAARILELRAGSAVVFSGYLLHASTPNRTSDRLRRALAFDYLRAESPFPYDPDASQAERGYRDLRDFELVAGEDPLDGVAPRDDVMRPAIRYGHAAPQATRAVVDDTARLVAACRARAPRQLCDDPWAEQLAGPEGAALADRVAADVPDMTLWIGLRTRAIDDQVRDFAASVRGREPLQIALLGVGLDMRPFRLDLPRATWLELDTPEALAGRAALLAGLGALPSRKRLLVPHRLDDTPGGLRRALQAAGWDPSRPALFILEGLGYYLGEPTLLAALTDLATGHPATRVVFDFAAPPGSAASGAPRRGRAPADRGPAPGRSAWRTEDPLPLLDRAGFRRVRTATFEALAWSLTEPDPQTASRLSDRGLCVATLRAPRDTILLGGP